MELLYTTGWTRESVRNEELYKSWLSNLKDGELVVMQQFKPADTGLISLGIEYWEFTCCKLQGYKINEGGEIRPVNRETGILTYWNSETEWGDVFPARIVPMHHDLRLKKVGNTVAGHHPVYEPLFFYTTRKVYLVPRGDDFHQRCSRARNKFTRSYSVDCDNGRLFYVFDKSEENEVDGVKFLYSQYIKE